MINGYEKNMQVILDAKDKNYNDFLDSGLSYVEYVKREIQKIRKNNLVNDITFACVDRMKSCIIKN